jgi:hypothetical protein
MAPAAVEVPCDAGARGSCRAAPPVRDSPFAARWLILLLPPLVPPLLLALYPQLAFKPQERVLTLDVSGITTTIGKRAGAIPWSDVAAVHRGSAITIERTNGNAFVVPARAFASDDERRRFADFAISSALRAAG